MAEYKNDAGKYFNSGYCCSESVLMAISEAKKINSELIPKIATGFCGGIAKTDSLCGALTGGIMGIGLIHGRENPEDERETNSEMIKKLSAFFVEEFGGRNCTEVCGINLSLPDGNEKFEKENKKEICTRAVEQTTEYVLELLSK